MTTSKNSENPQYELDDLWSVISILLLAAYFLFVLIGTVLEIRPIARLRYGMGAWFFEEVMAFWCLTLVLVIHNLVSTRKKYSFFLLFFVLVYIYQQPMYGGILTYVWIFASKFFQWRHLIKQPFKESTFLDHPVMLELFLYSLAALLTMIACGALVLPLSVLETEFFRDLVPLVSGTIYFTCLGLVLYHRNRILRLRRKFHPSAPTESSE